MQSRFKRTACVESKGHGWQLRLSRTNWPCVVNVLSVNQAWPSVKSEPLLTPCFPSTIRKRQMFLSSLVFSKLGRKWTPLNGGLEDAKDDMDGWETPCAHLSKEDGRLGSPLKFIQMWEEMFVLYEHKGEFLLTESQTELNSRKKLYFSLSAEYTINYYFSILFIIKRNSLCTTVNGKGTLKMSLYYKLTEPTFALIRLIIILWVDQTVFPDP